MKGKNHSPKEKEAIKEIKNTYKIEEKDNKNYNMKKKIKLYLLH